MRSKGFKRIAIFLIVVLLFQVNSFVNYYPNLSAISYAESDTQSPSTPTNFVLLSKTTSSIDLVWDSSVDNIGVSGYEIYQDSVKVATVNGTSIKFTGMAADTAYTFYVIAKDGAGNKSGSSNILNVTTDQTSLDEVIVTTAFNSEASSSSDFESPTSSDSEAPSAPANLNFTSKTDTSINLIWDAATDNIGVIGYDIYKDSVNVASVSETSCNITELTPNTNYSFYVIAKDESGNQSIASNILNVTTDETSLAIPGNLASSSISSTSIEISWDAVLNATGYDIEADGEIIDNGNSTSFVHNDLLPDSTHTYKIRAKNATKTSNWSDEIQTTTSLDTQVSTVLTGPGISYQTSTGEGVPSNFIASATNANVMLSWDSVPGATGYTVLKNGTTEYNTASTTITISATSNTKYTFAVRSVNASGTSDWSGNIEVWTLMNTPIGFSATSLKNSVSLSWGIVSGATSYEIEIDGQVYNNGTATTYLHSNLNPNESHIYRVRAKNANTVSAWTAAITKAAVDYIALSGTISANRTLTPEEGPYGITSNLTVNQNVVLTIMPGTLLRISPGVSINVNGKIVALGTTDRKITFTSMKDAAFGGTGVISSSDYWYGIAIAGTGDFNGDNLNIKYGYYNIMPRYAVKIQGGKLNLTNSNLSDFYGYGIYLTGNVFSDVNIQGVTFDRVASSAIYMDSNTSASGTLTVKDSLFNSTGIYLNDRGTTTITIENNQINNVNGNGINVNSAGTGIFSVISNTITGCTGYPIYVKLNSLRTSLFGSINNNIFNGNILNNLSVNRVAFYGNPSIDISITNNNQEYIFESLYIDNGRTVTIDPGVKMFGIAAAFITITNGSKLKTLGTQENPIVFTSIKDQRYGGIGLTNWDESWSGISLTNNAEFIADNTIIRYLYSNIYVSGAKLSLTNSELSKARFDGILFSGSIMPTIMFNKFSDIGNAVIDTYDVVDARYNYWGSVYGPGYVTSASSSVITTPWLGSELKYQFKYGVEGINPATGNLSRNYADLSVKSPGFDLNFGRTYNSLDDTQDLYFGRGWHFSFDSKVKDFKSKILMSDGTVKEYTLSNIKNVTLPNGSILTFNQNADGTFTANGSRNKLEKLEDGTYVITTKDQYRYSYNADGYLTWMKDRNDNTVSINLDTNNKITSITDQAERTYIVSYNAGGHVETITDSEGRTVNYEYENGILVRAIDPEGNISRYAYDS